MARGRKTPIHIVLSDEERRELESRNRSTTVAQGPARRGRTILLLADGVSVSETARKVGMSRKYVQKWAGRFAKDRLDGLSDLSGRGRKPSFPPGGRDVPGASGLRAA